MSRLFATRASRPGHPDVRSDTQMSRRIGADSGLAARGKEESFRPARCHCRGRRFVLREGSAASTQAACQTGRTLDAGIRRLSVLGRCVPIPLTCAPGGSAPPLTFRRGHGPSLAVRTALHRGEKFTTPVSLSRPLHRARYMDPEASSTRDQHAVGCLVGRSDD